MFSLENHYGKIQGGVRAPLTYLRLIVPVAGSTPMQLAKLSSSATARAGNRRQKASRRPARPYKNTVQSILTLEHAITLHGRLNAPTRGQDRHKRMIATSCLVATVHIQYVNLLPVVNRREKHGKKEQKKVLPDCSTPVSL